MDNKSMNKQIRLSNLEQESLKERWLFIVTVSSEAAPHNVYREPYHVRPAYVFQHRQKRREHLRQQAQQDCAERLYDCVSGAYPGDKPAAVFPAVLACGVE